MSGPKEGDDSLNLLNNNGLAQDLLKHWSSDFQVEQINHHVWVVGEKYILKELTDLAELERTLKILKVLSVNGIPVAKPVCTVNGEEFLEYGGNYYFLTDKLPGTHWRDIYGENYRNTSYKTGIIIAQLHSAFRKCEELISVHDNDFTIEVNGWIKDVINKNQYSLCSEAAFTDSVSKLMECYKKLPRQLIHRDLHNGNILFHNGEFSGFIDFDLSQKNARIFDICYFLSGLLLDHLKKEEDTIKWYDMISYFIKGYESIDKLEEIEKNSMCCLIENIELLFVAYFLMQEQVQFAENAAVMYQYFYDSRDKIHSAIHKY